MPLEILSNLGEIAEIKLSKLTIRSKDESYALQQIDLFFTH